MGGLAKEESMNHCKPTPGFTHHRLDAYRVAFELFRGVEELAGRIPRGHADLKDQLRRAAAATVRNLAEGANRISPRDKAARFAVALGEVGETDCALEMVEALGLGTTSRVMRLRELTSRVAAMLSGLIRRQRERLEAG
jgi:four helix bundle protein